MQFVVFCVVLSAILVATSGFQQQTTRFFSKHAHSLHMSDPVTQSTQNSEFAGFIANSPAVKLEKDEVVVDLDALAAEAAKEAFVPKTDLSGMYVKDEAVRKAPRNAQWFPMLLSPEALDGSFAGDVGFDPIGFAKDKAALIRMRDAEVKHARIAMLAAAGWPMSEIWHAKLSEAFGLTSILASEDRAPSILNGGLDNSWIIATGLASLAIGGALEFASFQASKKPGYRPGDYGFDPLRLYSSRVSFQLDVIAENLTREEKIQKARKDMELAEIKNGRLAMLAITADAAQEFISGMPVVLQTPFFFGDPIM